MASERLSRLLLKHRSLLYGYLLSMVRDFDVVEDLFQEVALAVLKYEEDPGAPIQNFPAWVRTVAKRRVYAYLTEIIGDRERRRNLEVLEAVALTLDEEGGDERWAEAKKALGTCLERLPRKWRDWIWAHYGNKMTFGEIGNMVGKKASAVQVAFSRIRRKLAECVEGEMA